MPQNPKIEVKPRYIRRGNYSFCVVCVQGEGGKAEEACSLAETRVFLKGVTAALRALGYANIVVPSFPPAE